ncbi:hypothetical protein M422DRAFT_38623, partial [Sphaerobolus stellatus SS14]
AQEVALADIHWEPLSFHSPKLHYRGQELRVSEYLVKDGLLRKARTFIAGDGIQYKWKYDSLKKFTLHDSSRNLIVESHKNHQDDAEDYDIDVRPAGMSILDDIIVSFVIMRHQEMEHKRTTEGETFDIAGQAGPVRGVTVPPKWT